MSALTITADAGFFDGLMDRLGEDLQEAIRPAAQAGAQVLYDQVRLNVAGLGRKTGNLASSIYQVYSKTKSTPEKAVYEISWNARKAPHAHLVENGHIQKYKVYFGKDGKWYTTKTPLEGGPRQVGAKAFLRNAASRMPAALDAVEAELLKRLK